LQGIAHTKRKLGNFMSDATYSSTTARGYRDDANVTSVSPAEDMRSIMLNRMSWGAVVAGVVVALVTQLVLNLLGVGIGAATLDPYAGAADNPSATTFSLTAGLWFALSVVVAALAGGYTAGRLSGKPSGSTAAWHGLTTWALTTLVIFYLLTSTIGGLVGGAYRTVASAMGGVAGATGATAQVAAQLAGPNVTRLADPFAGIEQSLRNGVGGTDPAALRDAAVAAMRMAVTSNPAEAQANRDRAAEAIARAQNISTQQAAAQVAQYEQQYRRTVDQVRTHATAAADVAAKTVTRGALLACLCLMLGAIAGWFGGRMGAVNPTVTAGAHINERRIVS
jgi:hypothetical protein